MASDTKQQPPPEGKFDEHANLESKQVSTDLEGQKAELPTCSRLKADNANDKLSVFKSLSFLDRFLAIWIFLAMLIGILLGNFADNVGPALQKGKFVGVSLPIGTASPPIPFLPFAKPPH